MGRPYTVALSENHPVCKTSENIRDHLKAKKGNEGDNNVSSLFQRTVNTLSPNDLQYRMPRGLIQRIRELLLDTSEETQEFRKDAMALAEPVSFVQKGTSEKIKSTILTESFAVTENIPPQKEKKGVLNFLQQITSRIVKKVLSITKKIFSGDSGEITPDFFEKHSSLLGYKPVESKMANTGDRYETLSKKTKLTIETLRTLEDPSKTEKRITGMNQTISRMSVSSENQSERIKDIEDRIKFLEDTVSITAGSSQEVKTKMTELGLPQTLEDLLKNTPEKEKDIVFSNTIRNLEAGKKLITNEKLLQLLDEGNDEVLSSAISNTTIGASFAKKKEIQKAFLEKRMDSSLAVSISPMNNVDDTFFKSLMEKGMTSSLSTLLAFSRDTETFSKKNPNWETFCNKNSKKRLVVFKKQ